ncbi:MAG: four helix bundle protein [Bacteroidia bacterium]|nr:four helix bundle protein [Bacteroidia bacterium]HPD52313.1 four helix bundle protein [Bacteroidia bacterium]HRI41421.1 four helix bundle protein [Bacteroidia bacterium]HRU60952.1 four helix bundle protein [Bacteroidia bacterium]
MASIKTFEDLEIWKIARQVNKIVFTITRSREFQEDLRFRSQIRSASVSMISNISEGFERGGNREFTNFLSIAKGSNGELYSQLVVAADQGWVPESEMEILRQLSRQFSQKTGALMSYLIQSQIKGTKYKGRQ